MFSSLKKNILLSTLITVLGLSLVACSEGDAPEYAGVGGNEGPQATAPASPEPSQDKAMSSMNMPARAAGSAAATTQKAAEPNVVTIENFNFQPSTLTVKKGTKVTWINRDDVPHTADDTEKRFKSGTLDTDDKYSFTFNDAGTYNYFCALHPRMTGQIIVK